MENSTHINWLYQPGHKQMLHPDNHMPVQITHKNVFYMLLLGGVGKTLWKDRVKVSKDTEMWSKIRLTSR